MLFLCVADAEAQTAEVSEVIYDDVPSEEPLSPDEGQRRQNPIFFASDVCPLVTPPPEPPAHDGLYVFGSADMIYEDVQKASGPSEANNGWSSSEFESYDEQSDNDAKLPAKSKVSCLSPPVSTQ